MSLNTDPKARVPVKILHDTGATQSFILERVLPFSEQTATDSSVLIQGAEMGFVNVSLHKIEFKSPLVSG